MLLIRILDGPKFQMFLKIGTTHQISCNGLKISLLNFGTSVCSRGPKFVTDAYFFGQTNFCHILWLRFQNNRAPPSSHEVIWKGLVPRI